MKLPTLKNNKSGFTIIEVVLVLAIAGLIFLLVFLALPQLQRSRRDTQRRQDAGRILSALQSYSSNNNGDYPESNGSAILKCTPAGTTPSNNTAYEVRVFAKNYLDKDDYCDPNGNEYYLHQSLADIRSYATFIEYNKGRVCDGEDTVDGEPRNVAIIMPLEQGQFCQDNQ